MAGPSPNRYLGGKEITEEVDPGSTLVCTISPEQWKLILMYKVRGIVLQIAQVEGVQGVVEFIEKLQIRAGKAGAG